MKLMKWLLVVGMVSSLTGCFYQSVDAVDWRYANYYCESSGEKAFSIREYWTGDAAVICTGGTYLSSLEVYKRDYEKDKLGSVL